MLNQIKALADEAIALQNKNRMDEVLREISAMCVVGSPVTIAEPEVVEDATPEEVGFGFADLTRTNGVIENHMPKTAHKKGGKK